MVRIPFAPGPARSQIDQRILYLAGGFAWLHFATGGMALLINRQLMAGIMLAVSPMAIAAAAFIERHKLRRSR